MFKYWQTLSNFNRWSIKPPFVKVLVLLLKWKESIGQEKVAAPKTHTFLANIKHWVLWNLLVDPNFLYLLILLVCLPKVSLPVCPSICLPVKLSTYLSYYWVPVYLTITWWVSLKCLLRFDIEWVEKLQSVQ